MRRYHHLGFPTDVAKEGEVHLEKLDVHVLGYEASCYGVEWMRYGPACPVPDIVRRTPHVAFEVDDMEAELKGKDVLIAPNSPSLGATVAFVSEGGAPVELLKLDGAAAAMGSAFSGAATFIDWDSLPATELKGERGTWSARTVDAGIVRLRVVEYSTGFMADHWCYRGHAVYVLEGEVVLEMKDGTELALKAGSGYTGGGESANPHRARSEKGARVFIVD